MARRDPNDRRVVREIRRQAPTSYVRRARSAQRSSRREITSTNCQPGLHKRARLTRLTGMALRDEATQVLSELVGKPAQFHDGQYEAIEAIVANRQRGLVVQRTGWGKSAVYFVATALLRRQGHGPTLIISPLLALMADQVAAAERAGIVAESINSTNAASWDAIADQLSRDEIDVLLISPERLNNPVFRETQLPDLINRLGMLVIDEAHCISDWGHDFRPDYRRIGAVINELPNTPILATTATANQRVVDDVLEQLGHDVFLT